MTKPIPDHCSRCGGIPARYRPRQLDHQPVCDKCLHLYEACVMEIEHYTAKRRRAFVEGTELGDALEGTPWLKGEHV